MSSIKDPRFQLIADLIADAPYPLAIVGGAVRDAVHERAIKDFDILVHELHLEAVVAYLEDKGLDVVATRMAIEDGEMYGDLPEDFDSRYTDWMHLQFEDFAIDLLVLGDAVYPVPDEGHVWWNFRNAVLKFDNTMNLWMYCGALAYMGSASAYKQKTAQQLRSVSHEREAHVKEIAREIGWTYVPLAQ